MGIFDFFRKKDDSKQPGKDLPSSSALEKGPHRVEGKPDLTWVELPARAENFLELLNAEVDFARSQGLRVLIYTYAVWSPGSVAFRKAQKAEEVAALMRGKVHVVEVQEEDMAQLATMGIRAMMVPHLFLLGMDGAYYGAVTDGGKWGEDSNENIARVMEEFLRQNGIQKNS